MHACMYVCMYVCLYMYVYILTHHEPVSEREREAASVRMREQSERFDLQLQAQRVRMAEDMAKVLSLLYSHIGARASGDSSSFCCL
jgi:hypothetical protein